ncbi:hypothetical protein ES703_24581 [subsurface metagenome]
MVQLHLYFAQEISRNHLEPCPCINRNILPAVSPKLPVTDKRHRIGAGNPLYTGVPDLF